MSDWKTLADMLGLKIRPIDTWPGTLRPYGQRERGPYSAPLKDTLGMLRTELNALGARSIILQMAFREQDLRLDGLPRANVNAQHSGVILCFDVKTGSRRRAFDRFARWEHNLRALAFNLEHLRKANLYGVEGDEQQYAGWKAIGAGTPDAVDLGGDSPLVWAKTLLARAADDGTTIYALRDGESVRVAYRKAAMNWHPDRGGDAEEFKLLQEAMALLKKEYGL